MVATHWACRFHQSRFAGVTRDRTARLAETFAKKQARLVAEKVECYDDFQRTLGWGYSFFQGYFFSRPEMLTRHDIPSNKLNYLRVLQSVNQKEMNLHEVSARSATVCCAT